MLYPPDDISLSNALQLRNGYSLSIHLSFKREAIGRGKSYLPVLLSAGLPFFFFSFFLLAGMKTKNGNEYKEKDIYIYKYYSLDEAKR